MVPSHSTAPPPPRPARVLPRATPDVAPVGIAQFGLDGRIYFASPAFGELLGRSYEEMLEHTFVEVVFPADRMASEALNVQLAEGGIPAYRHELRQTRDDGRDGWRSITVLAVRDARGAVASFMAVVEDISEQRAGQAARHEAEERLRAALSASRTGTFRWDIPGNQLVWDENLIRLFGLTEGETVRTLDDFLQRVHPEDRERVMEAAGLCASGEEVEFDEEFRALLPDGTARWLHDRGRTISDDQGLPLSMTGACVDVTDWKEAESALQRRLTAEREANARAERALTARDEVLAIVAHDLRNPVNTIAMSASMLLMLSVDEESEVGRQLGVIQRAATAMDHLIHDLLEVSRMEAGGLSIKPTPQDVRQLLQEARELFEPQARPRGIELTCAVDPGVPPLMGDRERLLRVLSNLVGNALKFTPERGSVQLAARARDDGVEITVADSGVGISPEDLPHVFDRYWQAEHGRRAGAGLGLAIAQGIATAHGGRIDVESVVGKGTTFRLILPARGPQS